MAKPNYQFEKRQRDLAKKNKQEEKRRQKLAGKGGSEGGSDDGLEAAENGSDAVVENAPVSMPTTGAVLPKVDSAA